MATTKTPIGKVKPLRGVDYWTEADKQEIRTEVDAAALSANEAADKANAAALSAETNSSAAEQATTAANEAADKANAATTNAENATLAAQSATTNAVAATANAETATTNANDAADAANAAATDSVSRTDTAVANAEAATQAANEAAEAANNAAFVIDDETTATDKVWSSQQIAGELAKRDFVYVSTSGENILYNALMAFGYNPRARVYRLVVEIFGSSSPEVYAKYVYAYQHEASIDRYRLEFNGLTEVNHNVMGSVSASSPNSGETFTYKVTYVA